MQFKLKYIVATIALVGMVGQAQATALVANVPTSSVETVASNFGGTLLDSVSTLINNVSYNGTARTAVYSTATGLDFYYQFTNNASSQNGIERFSAFDFSSLGASVVDVYQTGAGFGIFVNGTEGSDYADRTSAGVIGFNFVPNGDSKIQPGTTSFIQIIRTNATNYQPGNFGLLDGIGDNAAGFSPAAAVPEASANFMMLVGLGVIGLIGSRRMKKQDQHLRLN